MTKGDALKTIGKTENAESVCGGSSDNAEEEGQVTQKWENQEKNLGPTE